MHSSSSEFLSPEGLAELLDVPVKTVYRWRHHGTAPKAFKVGRHVRFKRSDVDAWLEQQRVAAE